MPFLFHAVSCLQVNLRLEDIVFRRRHPETDSRADGLHRGVIGEHVAVHVFQAFGTRNVKLAAEQFGAESLVLVVIANDDRRSRQS